MSGAPGASGACATQLAAGVGRGKLVALVGPAGAGKTTLAHQLIGAQPGKRGFSVSHTTRPMRQTEHHGRDYWFVARAEFEALRDRDGFVEWAEVHGNLYGTSRAEIERLSAEGRDILFDVDIVGAHRLWEQFPSECRLVFVLPPSWGVLVERLTARGTETEATLRRRLVTARKELGDLMSSPAPWWLILNDDVDTAVARLETVVAEAPPPASDLTASERLASFVRDAKADPRAG